MRRYELIPILLLLLVGAKREPPVKQAITPRATAPGNIVVYVFDDRSEKHWQYRVTPSLGAVVLTEQGKGRTTWPKSKFETGQLGYPKRDRRANSRDRRLVAQYSETVIDWTPGKWKPTDAPPYEFTITAADTGKAVFHWRLQQSRDIDGFLWSPNSASVAVLNHSEKIGKGPVESLAASSGHPVSHNTYYLDLIDVQSGNVTEYVLRADVINGSAAILDWSE